MAQPRRLSVYGGLLAQVTHEGIRADDILPPGGPANYPELFDEHDRYCATIICGCTQARPITSRRSTCSARGWNSLTGEMRTTDARSRLASASRSNSATDSLHDEPPIGQAFGILHAGLAGREPEAMGLSPTVNGYMTRPFRKRDDLDARGTEVASQTSVNFPADASSRRAGSGIQPARDSWLPVDD
jgi:hypothetical protein